MARNRSEAEPRLVGSWVDLEDGEDIGSKLWKVGRDYLITSKVKRGRGPRLGPETLVFHADSKGQVLDYNALAGSQHCEASHEVAIAAFYVHTRQAHLLRPL